MYNISQCLLYVVKRENARTKLYKKEMDQTAAALCVRKKRRGKQQQRTTNAIIFLTFPCKVNEVYTQEYKFDGGKNKNNKQHKLL
jgi:hypothetical protein